MSAAIAVFLLQGPLGNFVFDIFNGLWDTVLDEMIFTLDGFRELLCMIDQTASLRGRQTRQWWGTGNRRKIA